MSHQVEAIRFVRDNQNVPLFDEQGLGKSKIVIDALCQNMEQGVIDGTVVVCKKTLLQTWKKEIEKHSSLLPVVLDGTRNQKGRILLTYGHFYIVNYESLVQELELITLLLKNKRFALVLDESQRIKNPHSKAAVAVFSLRQLAAKRIIITGTPIANKPADVWAQFYFLDGGELLGRDYPGFRKQFEYGLKGVEDLSPMESSLSLLRKRIDAVSLRRTKSILELPEKVFEDLFVELEPAQKQAYEIARQEMYFEIQSANGERVVEDIDNYLVKLLRLTQIASNPGLLDTSYSGDPGKFSAMDKIVDETIKQGEKIIIWTSFTGNVRTIRTRLKQHGSQMLFGEQSIHERNRVIEKFLRDTDCRVLVANPSAAKEGLTLTSANNALYVDRTFKMDDYLQSQDRIHRIGQTKKCKIVKLIAKGTIDEYTDEILEKKQMLARFALGDTDRIERNRQFLSRDYLLEILGG
jgi:SNF2 family DNA or RNA helicase